MSIDTDRTPANQSTSDTLFDIHMTDISLSDEEESRANRLHDDTPIIDGLITRTYLNEPAFRSNLRDGGMNAANITVASRTNFTEATELVHRCHRIAGENEDELLVVESTEDIHIANESDRLGLIIGFQDAMPIEPRENMGVENHFEYLWALERMGVRIIQLTYNYQNRLGAGCCARNDTGLTYYGVEAVEAMNRAGVIIDLSHCGDRTTMDAIEHSDDPVIFSHAGLRSFSPITRNKSDEQLEALADTGGVIGITFFPPSVKTDPETLEVQPATIHDVLDQIEYAVELIGVDHVGFGSDMNDYWNEQGSPVPWGVNKNYRPKHPEAYGRGPTDETDPYPEGIHRHYLLKNLTRGLVSRGFSDDEITKILGGNFLRVFDEVCES